MRISKIIIKKKQNGGTHEYMKIEWKKLLVKSKNENDESMVSSGSSRKIYDWEIKVYDQHMICRSKETNNIYFLKKLLFFFFAYNNGLMLFLLFYFFWVFH